MEHGRKMCSFCRFSKKGKLSKNKKKSEDGHLCIAAVSFTLEIPKTDVQFGCKDAFTRSGKTPG